MYGRFSKTSLATMLFQRIHRLECLYNFDRQNGFAQVRGMSEEINRAYGEYAVALDVVTQFSLVEPTPPEWWTRYDRFTPAGKPRTKIPASWATPPV